MQSLSQMDEELRKTSAVPNTLVEYPLLFRRSSIADRTLGSSSTTDIAGIFSNGAGLFCVCSRGAVTAGVLSSLNAILGVQVPRDYGAQRRLGSHCLLQKPNLTTFHMR